MSPQLVAKVMLAAEPSVGAASNATSLARGVPGAVQSRIGGSSIAGSITSADALGAAEADASAGADASADGSADADAEGVATAEAAVVASTAVVSPEPSERPMSTHASALATRTPTTTMATMRWLRRRLSAFAARRACWRSYLARARSRWRLLPDMVVPST